MKETYEPRNFDHLYGTRGFSRQLLENHFALYRGYVASTNELIEILRSLLKGKRTASPEYAELTRRLGWEFNGMRLHELYFENLTRSPEPLDKGSPLYRQIATDFGSFESWEADFRATGGMRGIGWAALYFDPVRRALYNAWINEHDEGQFAGCAPLLVMDVFEHAYMLDYGLKKGEYIDAFFRAIDWKAASSRLK